MPVTKTCKDGAFFPGDEVEVCKLNPMLMSGFCNSGAFSRVPLPQASGNQLGCTQSGIHRHNTVQPFSQKVGK